MAGFVSKDQEMPMNVENNTEQEEVSSPLAPQQGQQQNIEDLNKEKLTFMFFVKATEKIQENFFCFFVFFLCCKCYFLFCFVFVYF